MYIMGNISSVELLDHYRRGVREVRNLDIADAGETPLAGADLRGIVIKDCFVVADFTGADLRDARIDANVKTCIFANADLRNADFRNSALCSTTFVGAKMEGAMFEGAYYHGIDFEAGYLPEW
ncbi:pentapeptide repeat-containing protein [Sphingomonas sp. JC676]|uniref:pentapeptide repeat-containing protein n=1 Tax=Sphingomonas sp. JC676 TaxID=2768065 RepID=UPI00165865D8|nr:pentapeptide repeat-containing protein [Sphingomonas sp. JC676]MBC9033428.1 pentapeptide repeat-containing protein [Sphingomonas sp. JC676]